MMAKSDQRMTQRYTGFRPWIAKIAAREGYKELVDDMLRQGISNVNIMAVYAAEGGHEQMVQDMIGRGANNLEDIASRAARGGYKVP